MVSTNSSTLVVMSLAGLEARVLADADAVARAAADLILTQAAAAIAARGAFRLCIAGGTTPGAAYRLLAQADADWAAWHIYHGDERCLPVADPGRNSRAAEAVWLGRVAIPPQQVHAIPAEQGAASAAAAYATLVQAALPFDLVLLGMGEDGHTASLFPGRVAPEDRLVIPVYDAPKPPPERVSLTPRALTDCRQMLVIVTGPGKADAVAAWQAGADLPVARVAAAGAALVLLDRDAMPT